MKLGLGGLAAMVALGAGLMLAAAPAVTMAQAAEAVQAKKLVRYKADKLSRPVDKEWDANSLGSNRWHCEDLTRRRSAEVRYNPESGPGVTVIDGELRRYLRVYRPKECGALAAWEVLADKRAVHHATVGVIPRAKLAETLARPGWLARMSTVLVLADHGGWMAVGISEELNRPHLLDRTKALAKSKTSTTAFVELDGKPVVKIVGTEDKEAVAVWLDPTTKLPLRIERAVEGFPGKFRVESGFEWDFALPAGLTLDALFSTEPPPGVALTLLVE